MRIELATTNDDLVSALTNVERTMHQELLNREFIEPDVKYIKYYDKPKLFDDLVFDNFPSANDDIYEAGMCLALERATACVMHLNRALECGLAALAKTLGVDPQTD